MSKHKFRLETLLKLRVSVRDERRTSLAEAVNAFDILRERRAEVDSEFQRVLDERRALVEPGSVEVDHILRGHRYEVQLQLQSRQMQEQEQQLAEAISERRNALVEADRQVKTLEKLKEKKLNEFELEQIAKEANLLDEVGGQQTWRRQQTQRARSQ